MVRRVGDNALKKGRSRVNLENILLDDKPYVYKSLYTG